MAGCPSAASAEANGAVGPYRGHMETIALPTRPNPQIQEPTEPADVDARLDAASVDDLRDRLLRDAFLFEDPRGYRAGVEDALVGFEALLPTVARPDRG